MTERRKRHRGTERDRESKRGRERERGTDRRNLKTQHGHVKPAESQVCVRER